MHYVNTIIDNLLILIAKKEIICEQNLLVINRKADLKSENKKVLFTESPNSLFITNFQSGIVFRATAKSLELVMHTKSTGSELSIKICSESIH